MQEEVNQKISQLIDAELGYNESVDLLKKIRSDESLKHKMSRYQAISLALKTEQFYQVKPAFSDKIFQQIQQEPTYFLPQKLSSSKQHNRTRLFAAAASTIAVAVLVGQNLRNNPVSSSPPASVSATFSQQSIPDNNNALVQKEKITQPKGQPLNAQFNDYLQAHNNSVYTNGEANFHPYAKVAAYGRD
jgi:sigma-E factor negative regulatory protein RseA